jgi:hypothetical protein
MFYLIKQYYLIFPNFIWSSHFFFFFNLLYSPVMDLRFLLFFFFALSISTYGRSPWTSDQPVTRPLPTQDNTAQKDKDKHPCLKWDSNPRSSIRVIKARSSVRAANGSTGHLTFSVYSEDTAHARSLRWRPTYTTLLFSGCSSPGIALD